MNLEQKIQRHREKIEQAVTDSLSAMLTQDIIELEKWLNGYISLCENHIDKLKTFCNEEDSIRTLLEQVKFRADMLSALHQWKGENQKKEAIEFLASFTKDFCLVLQKTPKYWRVNQLPERFAPLPNNSFKIRFFKLLKRIGFSIYSIPNHTANIARRTFRKSTKKTRPWKQNIPARKLTACYYQNLLLDRYTNLADLAYQQCALQAQAIWQTDDELYELINKFALNQISVAQLLEQWENELTAKLQAIKTELNQHRAKLKKQLKKEIETVGQIFSQQACVGGTLEFNTFKHRNRKRKKELRRIEKRFASKITNRLNTLHILADDWKFNQEIYVLASNAQKSGLQFKLRILSNAEPVNHKLAEIPRFISELTKNIDQSNSEAFRKSIQQCKYNVNKVLVNEIIEQTINTILHQDYPIAIDEAENKLLMNVGEMNQKRVLVENFDPAKAYPSKALNSISANELIEFEMTAKVQKTAKTIKLEAIETLEQIRLQLDELGRMVMFGLDTSLVLLDEKGDDALLESIENALSGIERANSKYKDLNQNFNNFINSLQTNFGQAVDVFTKSLIELTNNSTVEKIRYRIAKARAIRKGQLVVKSIKNIVPTVKHWLLKMRKLISIKAKRSIDYVKSKLGIQRIAKEISVEVSEFLTKSDVSFKNLPFVYRRLFVNEPLKDEGFYHARTKEGNTLKQSYEKWLMGNYMPILFVGEKGSGISSFLDIFTQQHFVNNQQVKHIVLTERILTQEHLLKFLGENIRESAFTSPQDFVSFASQQEPFVLILDRLQMLYLRQPGGFKCFKHLFELISNTSRNIFWICTCGIYASAYLNKAVGLRGYFPTVVEMEKLDAKSIENIIMLRHKTSGYYLKFNPSGNDLTSRAFTKMNERQQHDYLHNKYFEQLNNFTKSNIAFALQLWIRSIDKIEENTCYLNSLDNVDFSFMLNLEQEVIFGLHSLLLHERLDASELASVLNIGIRQAKLLLMRLADRGIVMDKEGFYKIHPLLYRQTVQLLTDKNLIH